MNDEQLLEFSPKQAKQQLNDEQLQRYNKLQAEKHENAIKDKKAEDGAKASEGLANLREAAEKQLTVNVHGIEFIADINPEELSKLSSISKFADENSETKLDDVEGRKLEEVKDNLLSVLANLSVNYSKSDWIEEFGDAGLATLATITEDLLKKVEEFMEQKKTR